MKLLRGVDKPSDSAWLSYKLVSAAHQYNLLADSL